MTGVQTCALPISLNSIAKTTDPPVVDPITLYCIWVAEIQNAVIEVFGGLSITQSTIDLITLLIENLKSSGMANGFLRMNGEHLSYGELEHGAVEYEISRLESLRSWASAKGTTLPAIPKNDLEGQQVGLYEVMDPACYDTLLATEGHGRLLISEDSYFRGIAK